MLNYMVVLKVIFIINFEQLHYLRAIPSLDLCSSAIKDQNCILQCSDATVSGTVKFEHPSGVLQGSCIVPGNNAFCNSVNYTIYQILPITYMNISSLDRNRDEGAWQCVHGLSNSQTQQLIVSSPQGTQTTPQVTITESEITITCDMSCQYPTTAVKVDVLYAEEGTSSYTSFPSTPALATDSTDSSGCDSYERNYKANFTFKASDSDDLRTVLGKTITCKCNFTHTIIQTSDTGTASASFEFKFKVDVETTTINKETTTTTNPPEKGQSKDKEIGIGIGIGASCFFIIVGGVGYVYKRKKKDRTQQRKDKESQGTLTQNVDKSNNLENKPT